MKLLCLFGRNSTLTTVDFRESRHVSQGKRMRRKFWIDLACLVALLLLTCDGTWAQVGNKSPDVGSRPLDRQAPLDHQATLDRIHRGLLERFDENRNGKLDPQERRIARETLLDYLRRHRERRTEGRREPADEVLERRERRHDIREGILQLVLSLFDQDGDGKLNSAERDAAQFDLERRLASPYEQREGFRGHTDGARVRIEDRHDSSPPKSSPPDEDRFRELLERFDANGDGDLDEQERERAGEEFRRQRDRELLDEFDEDGDGELNDKERAAARRVLERRFHNPGEHRHDQTVDRRDSDENRRVRDPSQPDEDHFREFLESFDENGDGMLDEEERERAREAFRRHRQRELVEHFDRDGDGELNDEERAAAREVLEGKLQDERERDTERREGSQDERNRRQDWDGLNIDLRRLSEDSARRNSASEQDNRGRAAAGSRRRNDGGFGRPDSQQGQRSDDASDRDRNRTNGRGDQSGNGNLGATNGESAGSGDGRRSQNAAEGKQAEAGGATGSRRLGEGSFPGDARNDSNSPMNPQEEGLGQNPQESFEDFQNRRPGDQRPQPGTGSGQSDLSGALDNVNGQGSGDGQSGDRQELGGIRRVPSNDDIPDF